MHDVYFSYNRAVKVRYCDRAGIFSLLEFVLPKPLHPGKTIFKKMLIEMAILPNGAHTTHTSYEKF